MSKQPPQQSQSQPHQLSQSQPSQSQPSPPDSVNGQDKRAPAQQQIRFQVNGAVRTLNSVGQVVICHTNGSTYVVQQPTDKKGQYKPFAPITPISLRMNPAVPVGNATGHVFNPVAIRSTEPLRLVVEGDSLVAVGQRSGGTNSDSRDASNTPPVLRRNDEVSVSPPAQLPQPQRNSDAQLRKAFEASIERKFVDEACIFRRRPNQEPVRHKIDGVEVIEDDASDSESQDSPPTSTSKVKSKKQESYHNRGRVKERRSLDKQESRKREQPLKQDAKDDDNTRPRKRRSEIDKLQNMDFGPSVGGAASAMLQNLPNTRRSGRSGHNDDEEMEPPKTQKKRTLRAVAKDKSYAQKQEADDDESSEEMARPASRPRRRERGESRAEQGESRQESSPARPVSVVSNAQTPEPAEDVVSVTKSPSKSPPKASKPAASTATFVVSHPVSAGSAEKAMSEPTTSEPSLSELVLAEKPKAAIAPTADPEATSSAQGEPTQLQFIGKKLVDWTKEEVAEWVMHTTGSEKTMESLLRDEIDGAALSCVDLNELRSNVTIPFGAFVKLRNALASLPK